MWIRILNLVPLIHVHLKVHAVVLNLVYTDVDLLLIFKKKSIAGVDLLGCMHDVLNLVSDIVVLNVQL